MFFEITIKRTVMDKNGNDKTVNERFITKDCTLFAEAEYKGIEYYNNEGEVVAIKIINIKEFINERSDDDEYLFFSTIEDKFVDDNGEKDTKYVVAVFARSFDEASHLTKEYMKMGLNDMTLVAVKRTKIIDLI